jgi:hypothetical protein
MVKTSGKHHTSSRYSQLDIHRLEFADQLPLSCYLTRVAKFLDPLGLVGRTADTARFGLRVASRT